MTVLVALVLNWKLIKSFTEIPITKKVVPKLSLILRSKVYDGIFKL